MNHRFEIFAGTSLAILLFCFSAAAGETAPPAVKIINMPEEAIAPDALIDSQGTLHVVYGSGDAAWHTSSKDNGASFTAPVKVNSEGLVQTTMGERGPKLALGKDNSIHVTWADKWAPGVKVNPRYARSLDGGKTFSPSKAVSDLASDGLTIAADSDNNVIIFYHTAVPRQKEIPAATFIHMVRSQDGGESFSPDERVRINGVSDLACSMCMMRARIVGDGHVYLAFRSAQNNIRDFYVLKSKKAENAFQALRVNTDNWELKSCPMCGPELTFDANGRAYCAFMSRHHVYWAASDKNGFQLHVPTPLNEPQEIYPGAFSNGTHVLMVWQVGPMSVSEKATVKWALYTTNGAFTGKQGEVGVSSSGTKATAFAGQDGNFYILTTAK